MSSLVEQISLMQLYSLGTHRGNSRTTLNPRLKDRVYGFSTGLAIIDLVKTKYYLAKAADLLTKVGQKRGQILVVGTSLHVQELVDNFIASIPENQVAFVKHRWLGGTLTNWSTIRKTLRALDKVSSMVKDRQFFDSLSRNEQLALQRKLDKLEKFFGGLTNLKNNKPAVLLAIDAKEQAVAMREAEALNIPIIAITNTKIEFLPKNLDYTIVCNTHSINALRLILDILANAYNQGLAKSSTVIISKQHAATSAKENQPQLVAA